MSGKLLPENTVSSRADVPLRDLNFNCSIPRVGKLLSEDLSRSKQGLAVERPQFRFECSKGKRAAVGGYDPISGSACHGETSVLIEASQIWSCYYQETCAQVRANIQGEARVLVGEEIIN